MIIVHTYQVPFFWIDQKGPYVLEEGIRRDLPIGTTKKDIKWFRRPYPGGKNSALRIQMDWDIKGEKDRSYKVEVDEKTWACNCHSFKFSGNKKSCKHIEQIKASYL